MVLVACGQVLSGKGEIVCGCKQPGPSEHQASIWLSVADLTVEHSTPHKTILSIFYSYI